ncbi:unnamed protein product [Rotaria socialis]|uniref:Uncharacterized protein n=1 Tax=Rotaria socialis TaxID=392032 RepID=A0A817SNP1_9BILA|nr:unnamed protein product [Rotaria socialis]CAF3397799.1 unnamed protein product [Rotaria socialis]CAF3400950.1 unnamed protein product [Rotaria socialis]CAF3602191.1 unnamed protein product [Rotaria socialis]CAF4246857.1 unnamed protein product [Rotaria socialis]
MGNRNSNIQSLNQQKHENNDRNKLLEQLYRACEIGDLNTVRQLLPYFPHTQINQIQYRENSALDVAVANGHQDIVQYLLNYDYFRGPLIDPRSERQQQFFGFLVKRLFDPDGRFIERDLNDCIGFQPSFQNVREHISIDHAQSSQFFMRIANASPLVRPFISLAVKRKCIDNLTLIIESTRHTHGNETCKELNKLYDSFLKHHNFNALIKIFTLATPQMSTILRSNSVSYTTLIYLNLREFQNRAFQGLSYRGLKESPLNFEHYRSAMEHEHIIELKSLMSTSKSEFISEIYRSDAMVLNAHLMIIKFDFMDNKCPTALDLTQDPCVAQFPDEEEVLVLPHTLFRVTHIHHTLATKENPCERFTITFKYEPALNGRTLSSFVLERSCLD